MTNPITPSTFDTRTIKPFTVFKVKGKDLTLYVDNRHDGNPLLSVVFMPENIVRNVPDGRFDARAYQSFEKYGVEYVTKTAFLEIWHKRAGKYSTYQGLPEWVKFADERKALGIEDSKTNKEKL